MCILFSTPIMGVGLPMGSCCTLLVFALVFGRILGQLCVDCGFWENHLFTMCLPYVYQILTIIIFCHLHVVTICSSSVRNLFAISSPSFQQLLTICSPSFPHHFNRCIPYDQQLFTNCLYNITPLKAVV